MDEIQGSKHNVLFQRISSTDKIRCSSMHVDYNIPLLLKGAIIHKKKLHNETKMLWNMKITYNK